MKETLDAIYENGLLRPLKKLSIPEGRRIRVTLESQQDDEALEQSTKGEDKHDAAGLAANSRGEAPYLKVREALKGCRGEMSDEITQEREDRV